ncbi:metallophos domain-containing protein [Haematococcus lacustris]|uniref:Metallophos domain-containing protein n=1 Tax=Haematococcus lacustris TaxID=44745 RepID=A0A699ZXZ0_HAELA|nr:metallophos domain-containing protein [Haematococcus lacustris]
MQATHVGPRSGLRSLQQFQLAIVGDLHLAPEQMPLFEAARDQLVSAMGAADNPTHDTGSVACFEFARAYLDSFQVPYSLVLGNHDLEGRTADLGHVKAIGLSTTGFRSNPCSHHEVRIDDAQMAWFEQQLQESAQRPVLVFTHAPPQGCGLKVIEEVHVKNRCAWLNHSDRPARFLALAARYPNIRLWFSGHFHLSHNYKDSISVVGSTAFVQTGVIGTCNRDGHRHSRLLTGNASGWRLSTLDHDSGKLRADLAGSWDTAAAMQLLTPQQELITSDAGSGWLCSRLDCDVQDRQGQLLVEYDIASAAPIGLVCKVPPGCYVRLLGAGRQVLATADWQRDGSQVTAVEVVDTFTGGSSVYPRNEEGAFFVIYQPNKWKLKQAKMMTERQAVQV